MKKNMTMAAAILLFGSLVSAGLDEALGQDAQLGVYLQELSDSSGEEKNYEGEGVLVSGIVEGSGAEKAGLKAGDIIVAFNGEMVGSSEQLIELIQKTKPGDDIKVIVVSDGKARKIQVKMGKKTDQDYALSESYADAFSAYGKALSQSSPEKWMYVLEGGKPFMGILMLDLTEQLAAFFEVKGGVLISEVAEESPAGEAGLKAGDIIVSWEGTSIRKNADLTEQLADSEEGDEIELGIVRRGEKFNTMITLGKRKVPDVSSRGFFFGDKDGTYRLKGFTAPPDAEEAPVFKWYNQGQDMDELRKGLEEYRKEMEALRKELMEMRNELRQMKKK